MIRLVGDDDWLGWTGRIMIGWMQEGVGLSGRRSDGNVRFGDGAMGEEGSERN